MHFPENRQDAINLDKTDSLSHARENFVLPETGAYLVGHSLGPASHKAINAVKTCLEPEWSRGLVGSWNTASWFDLAKNIGTSLSGLIGAKPNEVMVTDTVSVNLFKLAVATLPLAARSEIYVDADEFPTDQYMADSIAELKTSPCHRVQPNQDRIALASGGIYIKSAVNYRTSIRIDMRDYEKLAKTSNTIIIWDLSHATGVVELNLNSIGARFATGCTYKYLNAGPGSPAFLYIHEDFLSKIRTPLPGWMGHARPFAFECAYEPAETALSFASGTPPILSMSALKGALSTFEGVNSATLGKKSALLGDLCIHLAQKQGLTVSSPLDAKLRGGHVSIEIENAYAISRALYAQGFHTDFRTPSTIRFGCSPLYVRFVDIWDCMSAIDEIVAKKQWDRPEYLKQAKVT